MKPHSAQRRRCRPWPIVLLTGSMLIGAAHAGVAAGDNPASDSAPASRPAAMARLPDFSTVIARVRNSVVTISARQPVPSDSDDRDNSAGSFPFGQFPFSPAVPDSYLAMVRGSGFVVGAGGIIVTNNHVIANATAISVTLDDGTVLPARVLGRDPQGDVALLQGERQDSPVPGHLCGLLRGEAGRVDHRHRRPVRPWRDRDRRNHLCPRTEHRHRAERPFHPGRRADQSRRFRRPAIRSGWPGDRHDDGDSLAIWRLHWHRLCDPVGGPQTGRRRTRNDRARGARLCRHGDAGSDAGALRHFAPSDTIRCIDRGGWRRTDQPRMPACRPAM